ncbi:MAG: hypothetical protein JWN70_5787 [Planctomycetaceae bacterium]|nr:hypothetical protein [Planctomycetaceae bacterium]
MYCSYACNSNEHAISRRSFLKGVTAGAAGAAGFGGMVGSAGAQALATTQKHVVVFYLAGGVSQLETWDPKPGVETGGPFDKIQTSVPGIEISELLPLTAQQMHHLALIRSVNHKEGDHGKGDYIMQTGMRQAPGFEYPYLGSAMAKQLSPPDSPLPGYIHVAGGGSKAEAAFLGAKYAPLSLNDGNPPANLSRYATLTEQSDAKRREFRNKLSQRFIAGRRQAETEVYNQSYDQAMKLMSKKEIFDFNRMTDLDLERYGKHDFGRHCLMARNLIESGVTFVKVSHSNYDSHSENFNFHIEQLGEFDKPFSAFVADMAARSMLDNVLIIVMSEFGRTPNINARVGRDHWGTAWSICLGGAGIKKGVAVGKTNDKGTAVIDREVDGGHLFHTYYSAVGLDSTKSFFDEGRPVAKADPKTSAITEILA